MNNNLKINNQNDDGINSKLSEENENQHNESTEEPNEINKNDQEQSININNSNTETIVENDGQLNNKEKKTKSVTFSNKSTLIKDDKEIVDNDIINPSDADNNNINNNNSEEKDKLSSNPISDEKITENMKNLDEINSNVIINENNEQQKISDDELNDGKNEEDNTDYSNKRIILKLNENNAAASDIKNNILELEVSQLNNREQIRFIIKIASNAQDHYMMKYGFISKYVFYSKYHIIHVDQHVRLPAHFTEGKIRASEIKSSLNLINTQRKRHLYTMAVLNNSNIINVMDIDGLSNVNNILTVKLKEKLTNYVLLEKIGHYAACSNNTIIEVIII